MVGNKGILKNYKDFRNHWIACEDFYHKCLGHFLVYLYDPRPEVVGNFQYLLGNQVVESDIIRMEKEFQEFPIIWIGKSDKHCWN